MSEAHDLTPAAAPEPAPPPAAAPEPADWRAGLPDDIRSAPLVAEATDLAALAKQAIDLQAYQGTSLRIPSEHASDEDRAEFTAKLRQHAPSLIEADWTSPEAQREAQRRMGLPEEATGYRRPEIEPPEGVELDMSMLDAFQPLAHEAGLTQTQFETIVGKMSAENLTAAAERKQAQHEELAKLHKEWGYAFDAKKAQAEVAASTAREHGVALPDDLTQVGASTLRWLADIGARLGGEGTAIQKDAGSSPATMTPQEAQARISEMLNNPEHPMWHAGHPDHARALKEKSRLYQLVAGPEGRKDHMTGYEVDVDQALAP